MASNGQGLKFKHEFRMPSCAMDPAELVFAYLLLDGSAPSQALLRGPKWLGPGDVCWIMATLHCFFVL